MLLDLSCGFQMISIRAQQFGLQQIWCGEHCKLSVGWVLCWGFLGIVVCFVQFQQSLFFVTWKLSERAFHFFWQVSLLHIVSSSKHINVAINVYILYQDYIIHVMYYSRHTYLYTYYNQDFGFFCSKLWKEAGKKCALKYSKSRSFRLQPAFILLLSPIKESRKDSLRKQFSAER